MLFSCIALWESGMLKAYPEPNIEIENPILGDLQAARQKYSASTMPYLALSAAIIYLINAFFAFLFCCQVNFEIDLELTGNDWLQKITQPNFDVTKKKENEEKKKKG